MRLTDKRWTESEDKFLIASIQSGNRPSEIAKYLKRSEKSVEGRMRVLKLRRPKKEKEKAKSFDLADVRCPYFDRFYRGKSIKCEGFGKEGSYIICGFNSDNEWVNHVNLYCNCDWELCPVARVLTDKYEII